MGDAAVRGEGEYVLYWMTAFRRARYNFALQHAVEWARELDRPLVIFEGLRVGYRWASDRLHQFVFDGMRDNAAAFAEHRVTYYPWFEREVGEGRGLLEAWARRAAIVITDDYPCFFLPRMIAAAGATLDTRLEAVDGNGLLPLHAVDKVYKRAVDMRRFIQKHVLTHLEDVPLADPLVDVDLPVLDRVPTDIADRWPAASPDSLDDPATLAALPIDHEVPTVSYRGGSRAAAEQLETFLDRRLDRYLDDRLDYEERASSELSPWLHYGHLSAHEVFGRIIERERWQPADTAERVRGQREGWWGMSEVSEAFLDELVTWRELSFNTSARLADYDSYDSLPEWAKATLAEHADDPREHLYDLETFERADTHDEVWNLAQIELRKSGRIHNYLRMLWGKKILHWSSSPREAFAIMVELNNKWAVDGRDPNSYGGIAWVLGRYDRPWGPERPIFGKVRYMTSEATRRKMKLRGLLR
ncbi:MAG: deoxyribodipyrimidine photolyase [Acidobacteriota bacterium]